MKLLYWLLGGAAVFAVGIAVGLYYMGWQFAQGFM